MTRGASSDAGIAAPEGSRRSGTLRSKALVGVGALLTKKKLKCQVCGEYNDTGSAKPWTGPESKKYRADYDAEVKAVKQNPAPSEPTASTADEVRKLSDLLEQGLITREQFDAQRDRLLGT